MFRFDGRPGGLNRAHTHSRAIGCLIVALLMIGGAESVAAAVRIEGEARAVRIEASQASVADVLTAIAENFNVRVRTSMPLNDVVDGLDGHA